MFQRPGKKRYHQEPENKTKETEIHAEQLKKLKKAVEKKYPDLEVEMALMDLEGKVEDIYDGRKC